MAREDRAGKRIKLLYIIRTQNPTGFAARSGQATRLLEWSERRDVLIVEDDPYGSLYFDE